MASQEPLQLTDLMSIMKAHSAGKRTIQALADKIMLHRMLKNLGIPQMPARFMVDGKPCREEILNFVRTELSSPDSAAVVKPSHLRGSNDLLVAQDLPFGVCCGSAVRGSGCFSGCE